MMTPIPFLNRVLRAFACVLAVLAPTALAAQTAGQAIEVTAPAEAVTDGVARALVQGGAVASGDTIRTGAGGRVQLLFQDETKIVVGPKSTLRLDATLFRANGTASRFTTAALGGTFRFISGESPKRVYKLATPVATMGIRGTVFDYSVNAGENTDLLVFNGAVRFCVTGGRCVAVEGGCQAVTANSDGSYSQPLTTDEKRALLLRRFPLLAGQDNLLPPFRAGTAGCEAVKIIALPAALESDREDDGPDGDNNPADGPSDPPDGGGGNPAGD
jgi:hypothetical protein